MPASLPQIDFKRIRQHESSQQRAWEELSYLLVPDIAALPAGTLLERRAAPDGGIEFSSVAPDGTGRGRWAWQAKFLFRLDDSSFAQMRRSIDSALNTTPDLKRYTFILPVDRTAHRPRRGRSELEKWADHVSAWQDTAAARELDVEFGYVGHSAMLAALQAQKHAGALRYFFDNTLLTDEFFRQQVEREIVNLGERYDPAVHVELEIGDFFAAVCRSPRFVRRLTEVLGEIDRNGDALRTAPGGDNQLGAAVTAAEGSIRVVATAARAAAERIGAPDRAVFTELTTATRSCEEKLADVQARAREVRDELREEGTRAAIVADTVKVRPKRRQRSAAGSQERALDGRTKALYDFEAGLWRLRATVREALELLTSQQVPAAECGALLLEGPAGAGKSHLVADVAKHRIDNGMPTLLILGQHLTVGPIWRQIAAVTGVDLTNTELLQALEVAARLRGTGRALIVVDAINEGAGAGLWPDQLAGFLRDVARHPWIAVALTVRDTYAPSMLPTSLTTDVIVRVKHPGLSGHEEEALARYAEHYKLRVPDVPPLIPELTNPLFLRSLCRSVKVRGLSAIPREAASLAWVFDGLIAAVNSQLSHPHRLNVDPLEDLVGRAVRALAEAMLDTDSEALASDAAKEICEELRPERRHSKSLFAGLIAEGVLLRERARRGDGADAVFVEQVRFTYQRLADHLRAEAMLARYPTNDRLARAILHLAAGDHAWSREGLLEALVLVVPEQRGIELATLLGLGPARRRPAGPAARGRRSPSATRRAWLQGVLESSLFSTLAWRAPRSLTPQTLQLIRRYLAIGAVSTCDWLTLLLGLACVPDHPLNVLRIDRVVRRMSMLERDTVWSNEVLSIWSADTNPIARTIDWAWSAAEQPPAEVAKLAATLLAWLLTSPNRRLRDTATKALLRLAERRTRLVVALLDSFADVNDPYVIERLLAVACGHAIRHRWVDAGGWLDDFADLGRRAFDVAFGGPAVPEHLLIRHYARTCVEVVHATLAAHGRPFDRDLARTRPPYGSSWPITAANLRELAQRYGRKSSKFIWAATEMGYDFEHYVVERGIATDFVVPNQARLQAVRQSTTKRRMKALRAAILGTVALRQRGPLLRQIDQLLASDDYSMAVQAGWEKVRAAVPAQAAAVNELQNAAYRLHFEDRSPVRPDPRLLVRWIGERVLDLGWTQGRFGELDRMLAGARDAGWSETERFGKKYTWIAFYQLLGHLADHCPLKDEWGDSSPKSYEGPWQISNATDLDPTVLLRGDEPPEGTPAGRLGKLRVSGERLNAWWLAGYDHTLSSSGNDSAWLNDTEDVPRPAPLVSVRDPRGREWLVLESHARWRVPSDESRNESRRQLWVRTQANLVPLQHEQRIGRWATERNWMGLWMPTPFEHSAGFLGGYPDLAPWPAMIEAATKEHRGVDKSLAGFGQDWIRAGLEGGDRKRERAFPIALATSDYNQEASRDLSAVALPPAILPSLFLLDLLGGRWAGADTTLAPSLALGPVETEYSWLASGDLVAFASAGRQYGSTTMLCVRAEPLRRALADAGLSLWSWVLGEKIYWSGREPSSDRAEIFGAVALAPSLALWGWTVEHLRWGRDHKEVRKRLAAERPLGVRRR